MTHCLHPCCILAGVLENTARWHVKCQPDSCSRLTASCFSWQILIGKMPFQAAYLLCLVKKQHMETKVTPSPIFQPLNMKDKQKVTTWSQPFTNIAKGDQKKKTHHSSSIRNTTRSFITLLFTWTVPGIRRSMTRWYTRWHNMAKAAMGQTSLPYRWMCGKLKESNLLCHAIIIYFEVPVEASFWATNVNDWMLNEPTSSTKNNLKIQVTLATWKLENNLNKSMYGNPTCQRCSLPALRPSRERVVTSRNSNPVKVVPAQRVPPATPSQEPVAGPQLATHSFCCTKYDLWVMLLLHKRSSSRAQTQFIDYTDYMVYGTCFFLLAGSASYLGVMSIYTYASTWLEIFASACGWFQVI